MELKFELHERRSPQIKELRLMSEDGNKGTYKVYTKWPGCPNLDDYMRIIYENDNHSIYALDFDGGPFISVGYKLDANNTITAIYENEGDFNVIVEYNEVSN